MSTVTDEPFDEDEVGDADHAAPGLHRPEPAFADRLLDQVVPAELDWAGWVRSHPIPALAVAAAAGFFVGRVHGERLIDAASELADRRLRETADRIAAAAEDAFD